MRRHESVWLFYDDVLHGGDFNARRKHEKQRYPQMTRLLHTSSDKFEPGEEKQSLLALGFAHRYGLLRAIAFRMVLMPIPGGFNNLANVDVFGFPVKHLFRQTAIRD